MRVIPAFLLFMALFVSPHIYAADSEALVKAETNLNRIKNLVDAGAMPKTALDKAESELADARDEVVLSQTLYGKATVEDLTNDQASGMIRAAENQVERQLSRISDLRARVDQGVVARTELTPLIEELDRRRRTLDLAQARMRLLEELAKLVQSEVELDARAEEQSSGGPVREKYAGAGRFTPSDFRRVNVAFSRHFGRPLPVSAMGMTALHRSLGFDHSGRIDVALNPDQPEGKWLKTYLQSNRLPYFAFRAAVPGKATGAHIHLGPPSLRLPQYAKGQTRTIAD